MRKIVCFFSILIFCFPKAGAQINFDGVDDFLNGVDINASDLQSQLSFSAWVNFTGRTDFDSVMSKYLSGTSRWGMQLGGTSAGFTNGNDDMIITLAAGSDTHGYTTTNIISNGVWMHLAVVFDGTQADNASRLKFYFNGSQVTLTYSGTIPATTAGNTAVVHVGADVSPNFVNGLINDPRLWNRALSAGEVELIYAGRLKYDSTITPSNSLIGYWPLDSVLDGTSFDGKTAIDRSGNGNNATGVDGANNTGLTAKAESFLSYPWGVW